VITETLQILPDPIDARLRRLLLPPPPHRASLLRRDAADPAGVGGGVCGVAREQRSREGRRRAWDR